jgi:hypothetical protein
MVTPIEYNSIVPRWGSTSQVQHGMDKILLQCKHFICRNSIHKLLKRTKSDIGIEELLLSSIVPQHTQRPFLDTKNKTKVQVIEWTRIFIQMYDAILAGNG